MSDRLAEVIISQSDRRFDPLAWRSEAACIGETDLFFPPSSERPEQRELREWAAGQLCAECPSRKPCRRYARRHREYGYWGGESEEDRARAGYAPAMPVGRVARILAEVGRKAG